MRIGILGPLDVRDGSARPIDVSGPRLRALLIRLAVDAGRTVSTERLIDDLWGDSPPAGAANALQALVSRLRGVSGHDVVESRPGGYRLAVDPGQVDAVEFERRVTDARSGSDPAARAPALRDALGLWRGPALADVASAGFASAPIARLEGLRLEAVEERIEADIALGRAARLVPELEELTALHPLRERLRGQLMRALYAAGRQADALTVYEETRRTLADGLGVDPSPALAEVHLSILRGEPDAPGPALAPRTNLPAQLTSFVGRATEIERVRDLLGAARLVTLTGPGGTGKTRLACEAASRMAGATPDGVWFVPLAPVRGALDVPQAVLVAIGIPEPVRILEAREMVRPLDRLTDALADKRLTLVLDNCEHVLDAVATLADRLLTTAPGVRVLATSREPLGITGESLCPVPSLSLPPEDTDAESARSYDSVRLFTDRAAAVRPGFALDADTVAPVVRICRALDGAPLAIELAAARLRALTPVQVADRLDDRFRLLNVGSRTALPRHQTLRAVVDWSWELLDDAERRVLRRLAVFNGGATPESAEEILDEDVIDVIASLVDKSLVMATGDTEVRYRLLETVRAYATERLAEAGEDKRLRDAHAAYFLDLAEQAEPELRGHDQLIWIERLTAERDNCNTALQHAIDTRDVDTAIRLVGNLAWFWILLDYEAEAGQWAIEVWKIADGEAPPGAEDAYAICGFTATMVTEMLRDEGPQHDTILDSLQGAVAMVPENSTHPALAICRPLVRIFSGDIDGAFDELDRLAEHPHPWTRAAQHIFRAYLTMSLGDIDQAAEAAAAAYAAFGEVGDRWGMVGALTGMVEVDLVRGRPTEAIRASEEAQSYAAAGISPDQTAALLIQNGRAHVVAGDYAKARALLERGAKAAERISERGDAAGGWIWLSEVARAEGDLDEARSYLDKALTIIEPRKARADFGTSASMVYSKQGCLAEQLGDLDGAEEWHHKALGALDRMITMPIDRLVGTLVHGFAALAAARGEHERAAELLGGAHTLQGVPDSWSLEIDRTTASALSALGRTAFDEAYERGRGMTRAEALAL
ncbi:BTAD domain-containing putative transcriptional regulator [Actinomadura sp. DC4]|uniref:BTAD domain-containing putative transcriptional regulator n=1 Tax=Actinomadura sp. DC4 TaxID=3055069 RepID=UPI0025B22748|nr:BTAD domain-containing putative transcriptional regulator [Actinomadura sp. DC4]MDN3352936.1 BTAD domain-containing putative transcriptional regulator [Actinomadura sp. DC4]